MERRVPAILMAIFTLVFIISCSLPTSEPVLETSEPEELIDVDEDIERCFHSNVDPSNTIAGKIADSIMAKYPAYMDYEKNVVKKGWEYNNSIILNGYDKLYLITRKEKYLDYFKPFVDTYVQADGTIRYLMGDMVSTRDSRIQDVTHPSILLFNLYRKYHAENYLTAMVNTRNTFSTFQTTTQGGFWHKPTYQYQMWLDGPYMSEPFLVKYGRKYAPRYDRKNCFNTATYQLKLIAEKTAVPEKNLFKHAWLDWEGINAYNAANPNTKYPIPAWADPITGQSPEIWSRALGWYAMALVDVLDYLPRHNKDSRDLVRILNTLAKGLESTQDPATGLWYQVVDKGTEPGNYLETSGSAMFVYALGKASRNGMIPGRYYKVAKKGWEGVKSRITFNADGSFTITGAVGGMGVLNNYAQYVSKLPANNVPHAVAAAMYASTIMDF